MTRIDPDYLLDLPHSAHYAAIGLCVVNFNEIENHLGVSIHILLYCPKWNNHQALLKGEILIHKMSIRDRLTTLKTLSQELLSDEANQNFKEISKDIDKAIEIRNQLVHSYWLTDIEDPDNLATLKAKAKGESGRFTKSPISRSPESILDIAHSFHEINNKLRRFTRDHVFPKPHE